MTLPPDPAKKARVLRGLLDMPDAVVEFLEGALRDADAQTRTAQGALLGWSQGRAQTLADLLKLRSDAQAMRKTGKLS